MYLLLFKIHPFNTMEANIKERNFVVQYGKTGTRQKQLYTDDGDLQIITKASNAWLAILRDSDGKEVFRRPLSDLKSLIVGNGMPFGQISVYIDCEKESGGIKNSHASNNATTATTTTISTSTASPSKDSKIKAEPQPTRKFVLQGPKSLSGLLKPVASKTVILAPASNKGTYSNANANADKKVDASDFIDKTSGS